nr:putative reverse transcriptase domain-containing protein [Tanacetum cinerariifolium]
MQEALGPRLDMSMDYHPQTDGQSERTIQTLEDMLRACILDFEGSWDVHISLVEFSYNNSYHFIMRCASFEALYGRKRRSLIMWVEVREGQLIGPELVQETTEKISQIKDILKAMRDRQKIYADKRRKPLEVDVAPLVPKLRKNRTAHTDYIRHTQEEAATLREIVESGRLLSPFNTSLDYALTPKNKTKQIRPTGQITKSRKRTVNTPLSVNLDSNTPVLSFIRVILVSSASGSMS